MRSVSSTSTSSTSRRQKAAEWTNTNLLRYILDHPGATCRDAAAGLHMSLPNVFRLVALFRDSGILVTSESRQTGKRGPWSHVISLRPDLGCTVGVDLEATHVRATTLDFANNVTDTLRCPVPSTALSDEIADIVVAAVSRLVSAARERGASVFAIGVGIPGPVLDVESGRARTDLQFGEGVLELVPPVRDECSLPTFAYANAYCFAAGHHRISDPRGTGIEMVILNRFGLSATLVWNGQLFTGASHYAGDLGLLLCGTGPAGARYNDVCTGSSLLRMARERGDARPFHELLHAVHDPLVNEWLEHAVPAFAQAITSAIILYNPHTVLIEGIFNRFPDAVRRQVVDAVTDEVMRVGNMVPAIRFFEGDDLMGARGAALLARDRIAEAAISDIIHSVVAG